MNQPQRSESVVRTRLWRDGVLEKEDFPFEEISDYLCQPDCLIWADLCAPDSSRLDELAEELSLDHLAVEDAVAHYERPKVNRYASHTFMTAYALNLDRATGQLVDVQLSAFVLKQAFVTVHRDEFDIDTVVRRWDENADLIGCGVKALAWGMLDVLVDGHFEVVQNLDDEIESLEDILFDQGAGQVQHLQRRTFALRKSLVQARRAVLPMREVVNSLMRRDVDIDPRLRPYYEDLYDHVLRAAEWTESLRDMVSSVFETNLSLQDARLNTIMKKLTSYTALIAIPTAVTGFYGQNVPYPGFGHHAGFVTSIAVIVGLLLLLWAGFKRKGWL